MKANKIYLKWIARYLKKKEGFSLIELMIVVAIIGVLVAVAVPNFQKFLGRAKQTEAKTNLGSIYAAQKAFRGEWNTYFNNFGLVGFAPEGTLKYALQNGDAAQLFTDLPVGHPMGGTAFAGLNTFHRSGSQANTTEYCDTAAECQIDTSSARWGTLPAAWVATSQNTFQARASSDLDGDSTVEDIWLINETKALLNETTDI